MGSKKKSEFTAGTILSLIVLAVLGACIYQLLPGAVDQMLDDMERPAVYYQSVSPNHQTIVNR